MALIPLDRIDKISWINKIQPSRETKKSQNFCLPR